MYRHLSFVCLLLVVAFSTYSWASDAVQSDLDQAFNLGQQLKAYTDNRTALVAEQRSAVVLNKAPYDALVAKRVALVAEQKALFNIYARDRAALNILAGRAPGPGNVTADDLLRANKLRTDVASVQAEEAQALTALKTLQANQYQELARLDETKARLATALQTLRNNYINDQQALAQINERYLNGQGQQSREQLIAAQQKAAADQQEQLKQQRLVPAVGLLQKYQVQAEAAASLLKPSNDNERDIVAAAVLKGVQVGLQTVIAGQDPSAQSMSGAEFKEYFNERLNDSNNSLRDLEQKYECETQSNEMCQTFRSNYLMLARQPGYSAETLVKPLREILDAQTKQREQQEAAVLAAQEAQREAREDAQNAEDFAKFGDALLQVALAIIALGAVLYWQFMKQKKLSGGVTQFKSFVAQKTLNNLKWFVPGVIAVILLPTGVGLVAMAGLYWLINVVLRRNAAVREIYARLSTAEAQRWSKMGATPEERERVINQFFDQGTGVIQFEARLDWETDKTARDETGHRYEYIKIKRDGLGKNFVQFVARGNLSAMATSQKEWLRAIELLKNWDLLGDLNYDALRAVFLFEDDVGELVSWKSSGGGASGASSVVPAFLGVFDISEGGAIVTVLNHLDALSEQVPAHPVVAKIRRRLLSGDGWMTPHEVETSIFAKKSDWALSLGTLEGLDEPLTYSGEGAVLCVAPPGSGKTQCQVFPNLLSWKGPAIVLDVKGEIYAGTSRWRSENVGPVYKFSPLDPDNSHCFNPLTFVRREKDWIWEDSRFLADMMVVPSNASDPFWENKARDLLTAAIASICYYNPPEKRPMSNVLELMHGVDFDEMIRALKNIKEVPSMVMAGTSFEQMQAKTRDSVMQTAQSSLSAWSGTRIDRATRTSDWSPLDLRGGLNPTIYICLKPNEVESYISLLRVFVAQHFRMLTSELPPRDAAPVLCMLDELPRLRNMPPVEEAIEIGRQYGLRLWMFIQSVGQLEKAYPNASGIMGSCAVRIYMNPSNADGLADKLADELGQLGAVVGEKPVTGAVLAGPEFRDYQIVLGGSNKPAKVRKAFAWSNATLAMRMAEGARPMAMSQAELQALENQVQQRQLTDQAARAADVNALGKDYRKVADEIAGVENNRLNANAKEMDVCADKRATIHGNPELTDEEKAQQCQFVDAQMQTAITANNVSALQRGGEIYAQLPDSVAVPYQESQNNIEAPYLAAKEQFEREQMQSKDTALKDSALDGPPGASSPIAQESIMQEHSAEQPQVQQSKFSQFEMQSTSLDTPATAAPTISSKFGDLSQYQTQETPVAQTQAPEAPQLEHERGDDDRR